MDPFLVDLTRRLAARRELASHPGEMARALDEIVTSLDRHAALLAETEQYFHALTHQSLVGIGVVAREILGLADFLDVIHPEDRPTVTRNLERRFRGETFRATFRMLRKGGGTVQAA